MKWKGRHPDKALTAVQVRALQKPGRYADGNGLYLVVDPSGTKRWLLRIVVQSRRRDIGLGGLALTTLAEARERALNARKLAWAGGDPIAERRKAQVAIPTFKEAVELVHAEHKDSWRNEKHAAQWIATLRTYAEPQEAPSEHSAMARARRLLDTKAGVIAFRRTGDPQLGEFDDAEILGRYGETPDDLVSFTSIA